VLIFTKYQEHRLLQSQETLNTSHSGNSVFLFRDNFKQDNVLIAISTRCFRNS